jgi:hypothetical protein
VLNHDSKLVTRLCPLSIVRKLPGQLAASLRTA